MAAAVGLCVAGLCLRYGPASLMRLAEIRLNGTWLLVVAALLQAGLVLRGDQPFWYTLGTLLLVGAFAWRNRTTTGVLIASGGAALNLAVMLAYGGRMPVHLGVVSWLGGAAYAAGDTLAGTKGVAAAANTPLVLLGDWLPLPGAITGVALWSPGDLLLLAGVVVLLAQAMRGERPHDRA